MSADIDIDFADRMSALRHIPHVGATLAQSGNMSRHASGVYLQDIPVDPTNGLAALDYKKADQFGYFKFDFLNNTIYGDFRDNDHLEALITQPVMWELFGEREIVSQLAHIRDHFDIVASIKPKSVIDLAVVIALIRDSKRDLVGRPRHEIDAEIWKPTTKGYVYKKPHAIAFSVSIIAQLNRLVEKTMENNES